MEVEIFCPKTLNAQPPTTPAGSFCAKQTRRPGALRTGRGQVLSNELRPPSSVRRPILANRPSRVHGGDCCVAAFVGAAEFAIVGDDPRGSLRAIGTGATIPAANRRGNC